jgi:glycosyltransferase involved in cell wall biosynthesis
VPHRKLTALLAEQDVLGFPSVREFGGAVVVEAMAMGVVPVVVDYGGPGELATSDTGILVPLGRRDELVRRFREALDGLARNPKRVDELSPRARERAITRFTWAAKAREVAEVYQSVLRGGQA